jgi:hypothetical protein
MFLLLVSGLFAQETTGGLQGTIKDPTGAVVPGAKIVLTAPTLVGAKEATTDANGYYRFANLPPGSYALTATGKGFTTLKRDGVTIEVGHLPTLDLAMQVGGSETVVEVTETAPLIDVTTTRTMTNVTQDVIADVPHGRTFQSVIQFAPSARNEPLEGMGGMGGTGGSMPGSSGNGLQYGFSVGGAADSENSYLVEGQDTENISGGYSKANVPFQFIQEVQVKTSGIEAEHGGSLGGVVNVVMKKGSNAWHGELFGMYEGSGIDADNNAGLLRYDPTQQPVGLIDPGAQDYFGKKDHFRIVQPGATIGGPILKDKLWLFLGFAPQYNSLARSVNFGSNDGNAGIQYFTQDEQQYYTTARLDYAATQKVRLFASWLYQYSRETGASIPTADSAIPGQVNTSTFVPLTQFSHGIGFSAPNSTYNFGADITLTPQIVATTRFGYFFENYHDFGWPTTSPNLTWNTSVAAGQLDDAGNPIPGSLVQNAGYATQPYDASYTLFNANKHYQFDQDIAFFKSGWWGTHNFKFGYQLNHLVNQINQNGNVPLAFLNIGTDAAHSPSTTAGVANCQTLTGAYGSCSGEYGVLTVQDFATILPQPASDWNHGFFAQDAWTIGHGITLNAGIRVEKETLPAPAGVQVRSIDFGWGDKIAPRAGIAWDPLRNGKMKIFANYGVFNDVMKLLVAQTSWGAQVYEQCSYAFGPDTNGTFDVSDIDLAFANNRACPNGNSTTGANFASGQTPSSLVDPKTGVSLIENVNFRPWEPVAPNVKPYRQHESSIGFDYELSRNWAFEARWDRRRLDHVIEDASLADPSNFEMYTIVNPGEGVNSTVDGYASYLKSLGSAFGLPNFAFDANPAAPFGTCPTCPPLPKAIRDYDGVEFRLNKAISNHFSGMFAYTWSRLWGNYTGLTTTDLSDGGVPGRNSPDTTRSFDEPFMYYTASGKSNAGPLPTDRPNTFKGFAYYTLPWGGSHGMTTTFGLFQTAYQGSPETTFADLGAAQFGLPLEGTYLFGRGEYVNVTTDASGNITSVGTPYERRTPWYTQSDFNFVHEMKVNHHNERQVVAFEMNVLNLFNQHSVTSYYSGLNSYYLATPLLPGGVGISQGAQTYKTYESGYNVQQALGGVAESGLYGRPFSYQLGRTVRFTVRYDF